VKLRTAMPGLGSPAPSKPDAPDVCAADVSAEGAEAEPEPLEEHPLAAHASAHASALVRTGRMRLCILPASVCQALAQAARYGPCVSFSASAHRFSRTRLERALESASWRYTF
jgi:hypothetical protein